MTTIVEGFGRLGWALVRAAVPFSVFIVLVVGTIAIVNSWPLWTIAAGSLVAGALQTLRRLVNWPGS